MPSTAARATALAVLRAGARSAEWDAGVSLEGLDEVVLELLVLPCGVRCLGLLLVPETPRRLTPGLELRAPGRPPATPSAITEWAVTSWPSTASGPKPRVEAICPPGPTVAPYTFTALMDRPARLIYLSSSMHRTGSTDLRGLATETASCDDTKLWVIPLALAIAPRWEGTVSHAAGPGWVPTRMGGPAHRATWPPGIRHRYGFATHQVTPGTGKLRAVRTRRPAPLPGARQIHSFGVYRCSAGRRWEVCEGTVGPRGQRMVKRCGRAAVGGLAAPQRTVQQLGQLRQLFVHDH